MKLPKGADPITFTSDDTFVFRGREYNYFDDPYNTTILNDRAVEIPLAREFVVEQSARSDNGLEVGNVLSHYGPTNHRIVDRWEEAPGVENIDVFDIEGSYDWIVAISTLEHVRCDEPSGGMPYGAVLAARHLQSLLNPGGKMLVTAPFGQNPYLDGAIISNGLGATEHGTLRWGTDGWMEHPGASWGPVRPRRWASAVWVATYDA